MNTQLASHYSSDYPEYATHLSGQSVAWLKVLRSEALATFSSTGFPTLREEEWRYTNVSAIEKKRFKPVVKSENINEDLLNTYLKSRAEGFGDEAKRRIMLGAYTLSAGYYDAYYLKAQKIRTLIKQDFEKALEKVDIIATPVAPTTAFKIGEKSADPLQMYLADIYTVSLNLYGGPGISIPCGFVDDLPVGLQLVGKHFDESTILRAAYHYEQATEWHKHQPSL